MSDDDLRVRLEWEKGICLDGSIGVDAFVERW
jgi:hypothetical protein